MNKMWRLIAGITVGAMAVGMTPSIAANETEVRDLGGWDINIANWVNITEPDEKATAQIKSPV